MNHYANLHFVIAPLGFALGNVIMCPLAVALSSSQRVMHVITADDVVLIIVITLAFYFA